MTTDICLSPNMIGTLHCQSFHFGILAFADSKNIPMNQEVQRKQKEPTKRRTKNRFSIVVSKSDSDEPNVISKQYLYQKL